MYIYLLFPALFAVINWIVVNRLEKNRTSFIFQAECVTKPLVVIALLVWLGVASAFRNHLLWFGLGLFFSALGDVALLPKHTHKTMTLGLVGFFLTHVFYIIGLNPYFPPRFNVAGVLVIIMVAITAVQVCLRVLRSPRAQKHASSKYGIILYISALSLMLISALFTYTQGEKWQDAHALLVGTGAMLFFLSDTLLAWNFFIQPISHSKLYNRVAYHIGQIFIILGATLHFLAN